MYRLLVTARGAISQTPVRRIILGLLTFGLGLSATAHEAPAKASTVVTVPGAVAAEAQSSRTKRPWYQIGKASWYGSAFQGKRTAMGELFDLNRLTCAHRTLPLGSWIRVTNLRNRRSIFVRVNDRGPMMDDRVVDLSYAAAKAVSLGGTGKVRLDPVKPNDPVMMRALLAQQRTPLAPGVRSPLGPSLVVAR